MAMTAAMAGATTPKGQATYAFRSDQPLPITRENDSAWVTLDQLRVWGWQVRPATSHVDVEAEGRLVRANSRTKDGTTQIDLTEVAEQLGAIVRWDQNQLFLLGQIRGLEFSGSSIRVDATLAFRVQTFQLSNPNRLVIDLPGTMLADSTKFTLPAGVRLGQFRPDTVRIVIEHPSVQMPRTSRPGSMRYLDLSLAPFRFDQLGSIEPPFRPNESPAGETTTVTTTTTLQPGDLTPVPNSATVLQPAPQTPQTTLQAISARRVNERTDVLEARLSAALPAQPTVTHATANLIAVEFSGTTAQGFDVTAVRSALIRSVRAVQQAPDRLRVEIETTQPATFAFSMQGPLLTLRLQQPRTADGRISGKTIVIDAGHGGPDSGAVWRNPMIMEKTLALSVSRMIADDLTDAGANVIMTRNSDVRIALRERSEIANRNRAAVFVSVHFNSSSVANRKSGNMTFYHRRDSEGMLLAKCIQDEIAKVSGLPSHGIWSDTRIHSSGFAVLRFAEVPAVLLELGFINHERDRAVMVRPEWQARVATAVARGIRVFLGDVKETQQP